MKKYLILLILLSLSNIVFGQLKESQAIDSIFAEWNKADVPGCALGIVENGKLIYAKGYGMANLEYNIPNSASSVFRIGSTSKQFTAACIILLAEEGKLSIDDNLKKIFPDFPDYAQNITVRHLLNHTSGIRDYLQLANIKGLGNDDFYTDDDVMNWLVNQSDLNFAPGDEFLYSNSGYWLLGQIVNKVSGMNMADFAKKEIFDPLKMNNTHFHNDHTQIVKNRASGYGPNGEDSFKIDMTTLDMIGDGGIFTTINDIKKWDDAYYNSTVLSKAFWQEMTKQGVLNNGKVIEYASGLIIGEYKGLKTIRHGGAMAGFRAELLRFPEEHLSIAILANRGDAGPSRKANQVADVLLAKKIDEKYKIPKIETPKEEFLLYQLVGKYKLKHMLGLIVSISIKNDSLNVLQSWDKKSYNLVRTSGNTFQIPGKEGISITFSNLMEGHTQRLSVVLPNGKEKKAERINEFDISSVDLNDYSGSYYSKELDVTYNFAVENGILMVRIGNKHSTTDCTIIGIDQLVTELGLVRFLRTDNVISGFVLDSGRVKNLKFKKE